MIIHTIVGTKTSQQRGLVFNKVLNEDILLVSKKKYVMKKLGAISLDTQIIDCGWGKLVWAIKSHNKEP